MNPPQTLKPFKRLKQLRRLKLIRKNSYKNQGFTLLELIVTLLVISIVSWMAFNPLDNFITQKKLDHLTSKLQTELLKARSLALLYRDDITFCSSSKVIDASKTGHPEELECGSGKLNWAENGAFYFINISAQDLDEVNTNDKVLGYFAKPQENDWVIYKSHISSNAVYSRYKLQGGGFVSGDEYTNFLICKKDHPFFKVLRLDTSEFNATAYQCLMEFTGDNKCQNIKPDKISLDEIKPLAQAVQTSLNQNHCETLLE